MPTLKRSITGVMIIVGLLVGHTGVHAIWSPTISERVSQIRQHIISSRQTNGEGTLLAAVESLKKQDREDRENYQPAGLPGDFKAAQKEVFRNTYDYTLAHPLDSLMMAFNFNAVNGEIISNCLRNEIWVLEELRDMVVTEMLKAYAKLDDYHGNLLRSDYKYLLNTIYLLRHYGASPTATITTITKDGVRKEITSNEYFFGVEPRSPEDEEYLNYYVFTFPEKTGCPEGEFEQAFDQLINSWKVLKAMAGRTGSGAFWDFDNIWEAAESRARIRARQWITANQIGLTAGGESGARINSLVKGGGWDRFTGTVKTQLRILKDMVGPVTPLFNWENYKGDRRDLACTIYNSETKTFYDCQEEELADYEACQVDKKNAEAQGIPCHRFANKKEVASISTRLDKQLAAFDENKKLIDDLETSYVYNLNLNSVGEQNIYGMDRELFLLNQEIIRGYEGIGGQAGPGLPSLEKQLQVLYNNHCPNKNTQ
jgi:hypothetical protein